MALPTQFPQSNFVFKKPSNMTDEECFELPVCKTNDIAGLPVIVTCWRLSKEDLEEINKSGVVWVQIVGHGMPPISVYTENPFESTPTP